MDGIDLSALFSGGEIDEETVRRMAAADPDEVRAALGPFLREEEIDALLARIKALADATPVQPPHK